MAELRHHSDGSVESDGLGRKEANSSAFMAVELDHTSTSSTAPAIPHPPLVLNEVNSIEHTAYRWSTKKKWAVLTVVALCQTSMSKYMSQLISNMHSLRLEDYNAAVYSNAIGPLNKEYNLGDNHFTNARAGMAWFLILYGIGCELWAPWSEEYGRFWVMQLSLGLVNIWQILAGASTSWSMVLAARLLGGLCSAGGSVTLGMVADMFDSENQQYAVLWASLWSCLGSGKI